jgi:peptide/nickel transport system substrate-binding protein
MRNGSRIRVAALAVAVGTILPLAACSNSSTSGVPTTSGQKVTGGVATYGFDGGMGANYIFPVEPPSYFTTSNSQDFQWLMWRPLYWFGNGGGPGINSSLSLANMPVFSNGGKTVTVTMKPYKWSDGQPVTARDVQFFNNLVDANPNNYGGSSATGYPANIVSFTVVNASTFTITFNKAYNTQWLLYNELSNFIPIPQHVWDKESTAGAVGNYDQTKSGAAAVLKYLDTQAGQISTYATNPLWQTVDGPWRLTAFDTSGDFTMVPNPSYSGPVKPTLSEFKEVEFTDTNAEFDALAANSGPDVGYISPAEQAAQGRLDRLGYTEVPQIYFQIAYDFINFNNPTYGPIFKQLYIRQAMQELIDENGITKDYDDGDGYPTCGPIPSEPANSYIDSYEQSCPYSYNPTRAAQTLSAHGWNVVKGGVDTCTSPGTGPTQCGAGIAAGAKLEFPYIYETGGIEYPKSRVQIQSDFELAGIRLDLRGIPGTEIEAETVACTPTQKACSWAMSGSGGWVYTPDYYPSGEDLFETGASYNLGSYDSPEANSLIAATNLASSEAPQQALDAYQNYIAQQMPVIWEGADYAPDEIKTDLQGVTPLNVFDAINPENWYYTK